MIRILLSKRLGELKWTHWISSAKRWIAVQLRYWFGSQILNRGCETEPALRSLWQIKGKTASEKGDSVKLPSFLCH